MILGIDVAHLHDREEPIALPSGGINNLGWIMGAIDAPHSDWSTSITVQTANYDPARAAYLLLREMYAWFGHAEEDVPYTEGTGEDKIISSDTIRAIG